MKKRIIPSILLRGGTNVSISQKFTPWRTVGALAQQLRLHVSRECDELLIINTDLAGSSKFNCPQRLLKLVRQEVNIPIAYAGGISSPADAAACINAGFDKIYVTAMFLDNPSSVAAIASAIGTQSTGICLPYSRSTFGSIPTIWDYRISSIRDNMNLFDTMGLAVAVGAGELLLYNVDLDGSLQGLDLLLLGELENRSFRIPLLMAGGAGAPEHFSSALNNSLIQGIVAGSIFSLTQETPSTIRSHCKQSNIAMRNP